ncbi:hypothetical protein JD844_029120 [Phrynosoma platyrhinos]|uniref:Peptidase S1 domain-containing protein n=1 Tax=Phrynosoma platyrhinos TaxID=52577 RepID=A0ABQ7SIQ7_PHRPL|nr:hypothetical protein JD844_029120 [Phrynosoma platyrhinos]
MEEGKEKNKRLKRTEKEEGEKGTGLPTSVLPTPLLASSLNLPHWRAVIGASKLSSLGAEVHVRFIKQVVIHEAYNPTTEVNDIALMELDQPIMCSDYIQPACVPSGDTKVALLQYCFISGWGVMRERAGTVSSDILQEAKVNRISPVLCNSSHWYDGAVQPHTICAGYREGGIDSCQSEGFRTLVWYYWIVDVLSVL